MPQKHTTARTLAAALLAAGLWTSLPVTPAFAETPIRTFVDGREIPFDVAPIVEDGRTLVPARALLESMGATVGWDATSKTVTGAVGTITVRAIIGSRNASVNDQIVTLDVAPRIIESRTLIPLRFFAENLGLTVGWNGETRTISVDTRSTVAGRDGTTTSRLGSQVVEGAKKLIGLPYAWGGSSPATGFDCSGFVVYLSRQYGFTVPRTSFEMFSAGIPVEKAKLLPGDLVFFTTYAAGASHVGVYDGAGNFVHAQSEEKGVTLTPMANSWWSQRYLGARRVIR